LHGKFLKNSFLICVKILFVFSYTKGDAGGPMNYFNESKGIWTQIGIIGFGGTDGCQLGNPTGSYRLGSPQLIDWIQSICGPLPATRPPPFY